MTIGYYYYIPNRLMSLFFLPEKIFCKKYRTIALPSISLIINDLRNGFSLAGSPFFFRFTSYICYLSYHIPPTF